MVTDKQVRRFYREMAKMKNLTKAAMIADIDRKTARGYLKSGVLPSDKHANRTWRTRVDPLEPIWTQARIRLEEAPELEAKALFEFLMKENSDGINPSHLRTFQRRVREWRALYGPEKRVFFTQDHAPGEAMQTDFTWATELGVTIGGKLFPHMLCHSVLPHSNWSWATPCRSESIPAIRKGVQAALMRLGHVPKFHQTDNSTAATHEIAPGERKFNRDYLKLMKHYGMTPRTIEVGEKHQNGDVEALNRSLKSRLKQHLLLRCSNDFDTVEAYKTWLCRVLEDANALRSKPFREEVATMKPLTVGNLPEYTKERPKVSVWSTVQVARNTYSVPSRLIGERVDALIFDDHIEIRFSGKIQLSAERILGRGKSNINYRHVIWSLVKKPGAFRRYRYREEMFPTITFRKSYDAIAKGRVGITSDLEYLRILHLAATTMESEVETALDLLLSEGKRPAFTEVKNLVDPANNSVPDMATLEVNLASYDHLLTFTEGKQDDDIEWSSNTATT